MDGFAAAIGAHLGDDTVKSWADLNRLVLSQHMTPEAKRIREQERRLRELEAERQQERERIQRQQQEQSHAQAVAQYREQLTAELKELGGAASMLAEDEPDFVAAVMEVQRRTYDDDTGETCSAAEAAEEVIAHIQKIHQRRQRVFAGDRAPSPEKKQPPGAGRAQPAKRSNKTVSRARSPEAGGGNRARSRVELLNKYSMAMASADEG